MMIFYYVKVALHNAARSKVVTGLMVLAIAVGIGACMATLTVMRLLSGDPLPGKSARIFYPQVDVNPASRGREPYDVLDYRTAHDLWSSSQADRQTMVVSSPVKVRSDLAGTVPLMVSSTSTTADFFPMFEVPIQYGRAWTQEDDRRRSRVVVISDRLNRQLFGGRAPASCKGHRAWRSVYGWSLAVGRRSQITVAISPTMPASRSAWVVLRMTRTLVCHR